MRITTRVAAVLFAVCASVLVVATPAQADAGTASVDAAGTVHFAGTADSTALRVENLTATTVQLGVHHPMVLTAGPGCVAKPPTVMVNPVVCTFGGAVPTVHLAFGGGKDLCACYAPVSYTIDFGAGDDTLWYIDTTYPATVFGGDGADSLQSGPADDTLDGGAGFDTVMYGTRASGVVANLAVGGGGMFPSEYDVYQSIEALVGSDKDDVLVGNGSPNRLDGAGGDDSLYGEGADDLLLGGAPYHGKPGDDTYYGGSGNDTVSYADHLSAPVTASLNGVRDDGAPSVNEKDLIETDVENLVGGGAADTLVGDRGPNRLYGRDAAVFEDGGDFLSGLGGDDTLYGYRGADLLLGGDGDDRLIGGADTDSMYGGEGRDYASYETHTARVTASLDGKANDGAAGESDYIDDDVENLNGGIASDTLYGNDSSNVIVGDSPVSIGGGNDEIYAGGGNDKVYAGAGNDYVTGGAGDDTVYGSWGDDQLWGEAGNDLLDGGPGKDTCDVGANGGTTVNCSP